MFTVIASYIYNLIAYQIIRRRKDKIKDYLSESIEYRKPGLIFNLIYLILTITFIIILIIFIEKITLSIPSIPSLFSLSFTKHKYKEHIFHVALFIAFIEFLPHFKKLFYNINKNLMGDHSFELLHKGNE